VKGIFGRLCLSSLIVVSFAAFAITMFELFVRPYQIPYHGWEAQKVGRNCGYELCLFLKNHSQKHLQVFDEVIAPTRGKRKRLDRPSRMPIHVHEIMASLLGKFCMEFPTLTSPSPLFVQKSCMLLDEKREQRPTFVQLQGLLETAFKKLD